MAEPLYWNRLQWNCGWDEQTPVKLAMSRALQSGNGREIINHDARMNVVPLNVLQLISALSGNGSYESAFLPHDSDEFIAIANYLKANAAARTLSPPQGERTRMVRARDEIKKLVTKGALGNDDTARLQTHLKTLLEDPSYIEKEFEGLYKDYGIAVVKTSPVSSGRVVITNIRVIKHDKMWNAYEAARTRIAAEIKAGDTPALTTGGKIWGRSELEFTTTSDSGLTRGSGERLPVLDHEVGEVLLMHGTSPEVIKIIANDGFSPDFNKGTPTGKGDERKFGALGQGTYFGDSFAKVQTYIGCPLCSALKCECKGSTGEPMERMVILARCLLGIPTKARTHDSKRKNDVNTIKAGKHSVIGQERGFTKSWSFFGSNEFLLKSKDQMYPEFIVYWRRE